MKKTNLMKKIFLSDIWSIKDYGINKWYKQDIAWPIDEKEFYSLSNDIYKSYAKVINNSDAYTSMLFSAAIKISVQYLMFIHDVIVAERIKGIGVSYQNNEQFDSIYNNNPPNNVFKNYRNKYDLKFPTFVEQKKMDLYLYKYRFDYLGHNLKTAHNIFPSKNNSILTIGKLCDDFLIFSKNIKAGFNFLNFRSTIQKIDLKETYLSQITIAEKEVNQLIQKLETITKSYGASLNDWHINYLTQITKLYLRGADYCIQNSYDRMKNINSEYLAIHGSGSLFNRCVLFGGELAGLTTIGATHGNNPGYHTNGSLYMNEFSYSNLLLVPTKGAKKLHEKQQKKNLISRLKQQKIVSINTNHYFKLAKINQSFNLPKKISSVIFVEYPLAPQRHGLRIGFWYYHLQLAIRVGLFLKKNGIHSIMKRHPDRLTESESVYDEYFDKIIHESFETIYDSADAIIFPNLATTTFGFSLTTNKPIFIFEDLLDCIDEDVHELVRKRCEIIPSSFTSNEGFQFDESSFLEAIKKPVKEPNNELLFKCFYP